MKSAIVALLLIIGAASVSNAETKFYYKSDGTVTNLVEKYTNIPDIINNADTKITITAFPKHRYYKAEIKLLQSYNRIGKFTKTLEVWDKEKVVRSSVDIDLNIRCKLIKRIIEPRIEQAILRAEKKFLDERLTK